MITIEWVEFIGNELQKNYLINYSFPDAKGKKRGDRLFLGQRHSLFSYLKNKCQDAVVAEWLRRLTRNQIPSGSVGSNPTDCEYPPFFLTGLKCQRDVWFLQTSLPITRKHRWFSGRMLACHAGGPGSIPGRCNLLVYFSLARNVEMVLGERMSKVLAGWKNMCKHRSQLQKYGGAGYRSRYLSHAKRALYHLSYAPNVYRVVFWRSTLSNT